MCGVVLHFGLLKNKAFGVVGGRGGGREVGELRCCRPQGEAETPMEKGRGYSPYLMFRKAVLEPHEDVQLLNVHSGSFSGTF